MMQVSVQQELFRVLCPICGSKDTYHRLRRKNYRCRQCGTVFGVSREAPETPVILGKEDFDGLGRS